MRVLGIDCGAERTGWGVIASDGRKHRMVAAGTVRTSTRDTMGARLHAIARALRQVIGVHSPDEAAVEEVFYAANAKSALKLAQVRGVALLILSEAGLPCGEYSPLAIKQAVVGYGRAGKDQVEFMVRSILGPGVPDSQPDACDALAVALCHVTRRQDSPAAPHPHSSRGLS